MNFGIIFKGKIFKMCKKIIYRVKLSAVETQNRPIPTSVHFAFINVGTDSIKFISSKQTKLKLWKIIIGFVTIYINGAPEFGRNVSL